MFSNGRASRNGLYPFLALVVFEYISIQQNSINIEFQLWSRYVMTSGSDELVPKLERPITVETKLVFLNQYCKKK